MKIKLLIMCFVLSVSQATCVNMLKDIDDKQDNTLVVDYCDYGWRLEIFNDKEKSSIYSDSKFFINSHENKNLKKLVDGYKKLLAWFNKAKENNVKIEKSINVFYKKESELNLKFDSTKNINVTLQGIDVSTGLYTDGSFVLTNRSHIEKLTKQLEDIYKNGKANFEKYTKDFK